MKSKSWVLVNCFLRTYLIGSAFNTRGMQNIGLAFVMQPWLSYLYPEAEQCRQALKRYVRHYQCHMLFTPLLVAVFMAMEAQIAGNLIPAKMMDQIRSTTAYSLSGLGDVLYGGAVMILWSIVTCGLLLTGHYCLVLIWGLIWLAAIQAFKVLTYVLAFKAGLGFLRTLRRWHLIDVAGWIKLVNAVLIPFLAAVMIMKIDSRATWDVYIISLAVLALTGWILWRTNFSRELFFLLIIVLLWIKGLGPFF